MLAPLVTSFDKVLREGRYMTLALDTLSTPELLAELRRVPQMLRDADQRQKDLIDACRSHGMAWRDIALHLGLDSPQAAQQRHRALIRRLARKRNWTDNEDGPDCQCGNPTVVKLMPDGKPVLMCLFHTGEAGAIFPLPSERPETWPGRPWPSVTPAPSAAAAHPVIRTSR